MKSKSKGDMRERQAREIYSNAGYNAAPFRAWAFGDSDGFNDFDFVAVHPSMPVEFVQVKSNAARGITDLSDRVADEYPLEHANIRYAVAYDRTGWRLIDVLDGTHETVVDERDLSCNMGDRVTQYLAERIDGGNKA